MKSIALVHTVFFLSVFGAFGQTPAAEQIIAKAKVQASTEKKTIFLHFGASWCAQGEVDQEFSLDGTTGWIGVPNSTTLNPIGPG